MAAVSTAVLPAVSSLLECTDFSQTLSPFLHQLSASHVLPLLRSEVSPTAWYLSTNPVVSALLFALALSLVAFLAAEVNQNCSQVDRLWGALPALYLCHFALWARWATGVASERLDTLAFFGVLWGLRLNYNFWRKGGYTVGHEDYRWAIVRSRMPKLAFTLLNITFISLFQNLLLLAVAFPAYVLLLCGTIKAGDSSTAAAAATTTIPMNTADTVMLCLLVVLLAVETKADQEQWAFQSSKRVYAETGTVPHGFAAEDLDRGFVVRGLWSLCRHPNFTMEQAIWLAVYQWSCWQTGAFYNWTGLGAASYLAIFQGSTVLTEAISADKYPEYAEYQKLVNRFVPGVPVFRRGDKKLD